MQPADEWRDRPDRPGCVTAYALLVWLGAAALLLGGCYLAIIAASGPEPDPVIAIIAGALGLTLAAIYGAVGRGLWLMRPFGWWAVVIVQGAALVAGICNLFLTISQLEVDPNTFVPVLGGMAVSGFILYWFYQNRALFGVNLGRPAAGAEGQPAAARSRGQTILIVVAVLAVFLLCLLPVLIIASLSLLNPAISRIFTDIQNSLTTPAP